MLEDTDIQKLSTIFATKDDTAELKQDVSVLKTDVAELKQDVRGLKIDMIEVKGQIIEIKEELGDMKEMLQGVITTLDAIAKPIVEIKQENAMSNGISQRHEKWIKQIAQETNVQLVVE